MLETLLFALPAGAAAERRARAEAALASAGLAGYGPRLPHTLSGGQRSRVSVLRALLAQAFEDEGAKALAQRHVQPREGFVEQQRLRLREQRIPAVLVTHDAHDVPAGAQVIQLDDQADPAEDGAVDA